MVSAPLFLLLLLPVTMSLEEGVANIDSFKKTTASKVFPRLVDDGISPLQRNRKGTREQLNLQPSLALSPETHVLSALDIIVYRENFNRSHPKVVFEKSSYGFEGICFDNSETAMGYWITPGTNHFGGITAFYPGSPGPKPL